MWLIIVSFHKFRLPSQQPPIADGHVTSSTWAPQPDLAGVERGAPHFTSQAYSWAEPRGEALMPTLAWMHLRGLVATFTSQLGSIALPPNLHVNSVSHSSWSEKRGGGGR